MTRLPPTRLVVRGGEVVLADRVERLDVVAVDGQIVELVPPGTAERAGATVIDAGGLTVFPGAVDPHVHFDEPGRTDWEGFDSGSAAAAAGGVTTVVDMPIDSDPPTTTARLVGEKANAARRSSRVDVALWGGLVPSSTSHLDEMAEAGVVGFKAFGCPSGWDDFPAVDEPALIAGFAASARWHLPVALHAELAAYGHTVASERAAVAWAAPLAVAAGAHLHIVHASAIEAVREAVRNPGVTVETCPHYLLLTDADADRIGAEARCNPPIRDQANQDALWAAVRDGTIACIASDHSPCPTALKAGPDPWAGITGVDTLLPSLLSSGRLDHVMIATVLTAAARLLRLPGKGTIRAGADADLVLVDPAERWTVGPTTVHNRHRRSPFTGTELRGRVRQTIVRGRSVHDVDAGPGPAGGGRVVRPTAWSPSVEAVDQGGVTPPR